MKTAFAVGAFAVVMAGSGVAFGTPNALDFRHQAMASDAFEIASSKIALGQSQNAKVKAFAHLMIHDHTLTTKHLLASQTALSKAGIDAKTAPGPDGKYAANDVIDQAHADMLNKIGSEKGKDFDSDYMSDQLKGHEDAVSLFEDYAKNGDDPALKRWAARTLPKLWMHLGKGRTIDKAL